MGESGDSLGAEEMDNADFSDFSPVVVVGREDKLKGIVG